LCPPGSDIMYLHRQYFNTFFELQFKFWLFVCSPLPFDMSLESLALQFPSGSSLQLTYAPWLHPTLRALNWFENSILFKHYRNKKWRVWASEFLDWNRWK
jgi:hypothetical protein